MKLSSVSLPRGAKTYLGTVYNKNTRQMYEIALKHFYGYVKKTKIDDLDLLNFINHLKSNGMKDSSIRYYLTVLKMYYNFNNIPTTRARFRYIHKDLMIYLAEDEIGRFFSVKMGDNYRAAYMLMTFSGLRLKEVLNIKRKDIDFANRSVEVTGKFGKHRIVFFTPGTAEVLKRLCSGKGNIIKVSRRSLQGVIKVVSKKAKISKWRKITCHKLRHTFAMAWRRNHGLWEMLKRLMGHSASDVTEIYTDFTLDEIKDAYDKIITPLEAKLGVV